jgi:Transposase IS116/IS110/IS902 family
MVSGIGPVISTARVVTVPDARLVASGRHFAAWLGLVPRQHPSGGAFGISRGLGALPLAARTGARPKSTRNRPHPGNSEMPKVTLFTVAAWLALTLPAGAACLDEVAQLEQRLSQLEAADARDQAAGDETVRMTMEDGREVAVPVEQTEDASQPQESWFGESPPAPEGAEEELQSAREMAEGGDEPGCREHAEQAARIISALEEQQR